jgi:hypothetical protein
VKLVGRVPSLPPPARRRRGRPPRYPDRLFLQALVMMMGFFAYPPEKVYSRCIPPEIVGL